MSRPHMGQVPPVFTNCKSSTCAHDPLEECLLRRNGRAARTVTLTAPVIEKFCAAKVVFKRMESINMEALPELKDKAVSKLARITPKLKELSIAKCQRITDRGLEAVATGCPDLVTLNVNYDSKVVPIGAPGVVWPPSGLSKLRAINLRGFEVAVDMSDPKWGFTLTPLEPGQRAWSLRAPTEADRLELARRLVIATLMNT